MQPGRDGEGHPISCSTLCWSISNMQRSGRRGLDKWSSICFPLRCYLLVPSLHSTIGNFHSCKDYILQLSNQLNVITFYIIMSIGFSILLKNTISVIKSINELKCQCFNYSSFICFYLRVQKMTLPWHVTNDGISCVILKNHWPY